MKYLLRLSALVISLFGSVLTADELNYYPTEAYSTPCEVSDCNFLQCPNSEYLVSLRRNQGQSLANRSSYTTLDGYAFPKCIGTQFGTIWPFINLRGHYIDRGERGAANVGVGCRIAPTCTDFVFGINTYYDYRNYRGANLNQWGVGLEMLGCCWSFRLNGYWPLKESIKNSSCFFDGYSGNYFIKRTGYITPLKGLDFEVEALVAKMCWGNIYLALGSYYYDGNKCNKSIVGGDCRLTAQFCNYFSFDINATHDRHFKTRVMAQLMVTIPLCGQINNCCCCNPVFRPVYRQELIVLEKRNKWVWNF